MGLRFRKSVKLAPGVKLNLGKKSAGISVGGKYGGVSYNTKTGSRARVSAPGTGLSYSTKIGESNITKSTQASSGNNNGACLITCLKIIGILIFIIMLGSLIASLGDNTPSDNTESAINSEVNTELEDFSSEIVSTIDTETQEQENTEVISSEIETESQDVSNTPEATPVPEPQPDSEKEQTETSAEKYAVNNKNGKIHMIGKCPATKTGDQAMTDAIYFDTYEEALEYSEKIAPDLKNRECGNCW